MEDIFDKKIVSVPMPEKSIGIDTKDKVIEKAAEDGVSNSLQTLTTISMDRDMAYNQVDDMCQDSRIASALEAYTEETARIGDDGRIVYVDSNDSDIGKMVTHFLDAMQIDKYIYSWAYSLIKYGDVYVRLYRESDVHPNEKKPKENNRLNEDINVQYYNKVVDPYADYCELIRNPAEMFELKQFGETKLYIQCPISSLSINAQDTRTGMSYRLINYQNDSDVNLYQPTEFVHGCLNQGYSRVGETIEVFDGDDDNSDSSVYTVNKGQSMFYNVYPLWRQLQLLENSTLLNRINSNAILRLVMVDVGNLPDGEDVMSMTTAVKQMCDTKLSISSKTMSNLYLSDQPTVNYAVMPVRGTVGQISFQDIGGTNTENINLDDINYFKDKLFGALRLPKSMFGETNGDAAGFDAGGSIAQQSLLFGKAVRRIQNVLIQMITDIINLRLLDRGCEGYIDQFAIKMHFPITQEDTVNQTHRKEQIELVLRIMDSLEDIADDSAKLTILKYLISTVIDDSDVLNAIQEQLENQSSKAENEESEEENYESEEPEPSSTGGGLGNAISADIGSGEEPVEEIETEETEPET